MLFIGCGSGDKPIAPAPKKPEVTLPAVARAPEGAVIPRMKQPSESDDVVSADESPAGDGTESVEQPEIATNPIDGGFDDPENLEPQPLPEGGSPFDTDDFPQPGALNRPGEGNSTPSVDPPVAEIEPRPPVTEENRPPDATGLPPGLEPIPQPWRTAHRGFYQRVGALLRGLQQGGKPLPRNTAEFLKLLESRHIELPPAPDGTALVYDPHRGEVGTLFLDTTPTADQSPADLARDELVEAEVGLGEKGHYESQNIFSTAISARFRVEERILLGQIKQGLQTFRAVHGRKPKDHQEFITKVVAENGYRLPELPEGQSYFYDPSRGLEGELMVRIPKQD